MGLQQCTVPKTLMICASEYSLHQPLCGRPQLRHGIPPYYLAREWVRAGHAVTVVAANFSHVRARQPQAGQEEVDGITYHWLPTPCYQNVTGTCQEHLELSAPGVATDARAGGSLRAGCSDCIQHLPHGHLGSAPHGPVGGCAAGI